MSAFNQFTFEDRLNYSSPPSQSFLIFNTSNEELILLRLILGTVNINHTLSGKTIKQNTNYCLTDFEKWNKITKSKLLTFLELQDIDLNQLHKYYTLNHILGNKKFFTQMLLELSNFLYQKSRKNHTTAFLHLYRITELISYCVPLFYVSQVKNYSKTYTDLKKYFAGSGEELSFFKNFINNHLFTDISLLNIDLPILIKAPNLQLQQQYFNAIKKLCDNNKHIEIKSSTMPSQITITRKGLTSLIFDLRNRYFHLATGGWQENFDSSEIMEVDLFYENINDIACNWLCVVFLEVMKKAYESQ